MIKITSKTGDVIITSANIRFKVSIAGSPMWMFPSGIRLGDGLITTDGKIEYIENKAYVDDKVENIPEKYVCVRVV